MQSNVRVRNQLLRSFYPNFSKESCRLNSCKHRTSLNSVVYHLTIEHFNFVTNAGLWRLSWFSFVSIEVFLRTYPHFPNPEYFPHNIEFRACTVNDPNTHSKSRLTPMKKLQLDGCGAFWSNSPCVDKNLCRFCLWALTLLQ